MGFLRSLGQSYLRWRHSKGYGVHSPFAYNLVMNVVSPGKYGYYGYEEIESVFPDRMTAEERKIRLEARLVLRLLVNLSLKRLVAIGKPHPAFEKSALSAGTTMKQISDVSVYMPERGDLLLLAKDCPERITSDRFLENGVAILAFDIIDEKKVMPEKPMKTGLCLKDKGIVLLVPNEDMAFVEYSVNF